MTPLDKSIAAALQKDQQPQTEAQRIRDEAEFEAVMESARYVATANSRMREEIALQRTKQPIQKQPRERSTEEADLVAGIVQALELTGWIVLRVGQWRADKSGTTAGCPDLFVWVPAKNGWTGIEVKTERGRLSPAQKRLEELGVIVVVRSISEAMYAVGQPYARPEGR